MNCDTCRLARLYAQRVSHHWRIRHCSATCREIPPRTVKLHLCSFSNCAADDDALTCRFAEFSSKWRARSSHIRGGSENQTVVQDSDPSNVAPDVASAESTGGAGTNYEGQVAGIVLARMLVGDRVPGLDFKIERVLFQTRYAGHLLDDITIFGTDRSGTDRLIDCQSKRTIAPIPTTKSSLKRIARCLHAIRDKGDKARSTIITTLCTQAAHPRASEARWTPEQLKPLSQDTSR
jgi:hypothetical protein